MGDRSESMSSSRGVLPATAHSTLRVAMRPRVVRTPVTRGPEPESSTSMPITSVF
jgi:hypothetical protein